MLVSFAQHLAIFASDLELIRGQFRVLTQVKLDRYNGVSGYHSLALPLRGYGLRSRRIGRKYYSPKIVFDECVSVATHWSKHIHRNYFWMNKLTPFEM